MYCQEGLQDKCKIALSANLSSSSSSSRRTKQGGFHLRATSADATITRLAGGGKIGRAEETSSCTDNKFKGDDNHDDHDDKDDNKDKDGDDNDDHDDGDDDTLETLDRRQGEEEGEQSSSAEFEVVRT